MKTLLTFSLLLASSVTGSVLAQTPDTAAPTSASGCIALSGDHQVVRKDADQSVLLRNGSDHYVVRFTRSCSSAARSRKLEFSTPSQEGQLCGAGGSALRTDSQSCQVASVEPISAELFARRSRP